MKGPITITIDGADETAVIGPVDRVDYTRESSPKYYWTDEELLDGWNDITIRVRNATAVFTPKRKIGSHWISTGNCLYVWNGQEFVRWGEVDDDGTVHALGDGFAMTEATAVELEPWSPDDV